MAAVAPLDDAAGNFRRQTQQQGAHPSLDILLASGIVIVVIVIHHTLNGAAGRWLAVTSCLGSAAAMGLSELLWLRLACAGGAAAATAGAAGRWERVLHEPVARFLIGRMHWGVRRGRQITHALVQLLDMVRVG